MYKERSMSQRSDGEQATDLHSPALAGFGGSYRHFDKGDFLFVAGESGHGIFLLRSGRVKLSTSMPDGKLVIVDIASSGAILGLVAVVGACDYELNAEAIEPCSVEYLSSSDARRRMQYDCAFSWRAAAELAKLYSATHSVLCTLAQSDPLVIKLARLVDDWLSESGTDSVSLDNVFTHQQIAEMLGTTRETVTRSFRQMRETGVLTLKGHTLEVHDIRRLRLLARGCDASHRQPLHAPPNI